MTACKALREFLVICFLLGPLAAAAASQNASGRCPFPWEGRLPPDVVVYVAGGYGGAAIPEAIEPTGSQAGRIDIDINRPDRPVALVLVAYDPVVWNIRTTPGTRVVAVWASGYYRPLVAGLDPSTPVVRSSYTDRSPCAGYSYNVGVANPMARAAFQRNAELYYDLTRDKRIAIGAPLAAGQSFVAAGPAYQRLIDPALDVQGPAALRKAEAAGKVRKMTAADMERWLQFLRACWGPLDTPQVANPGPSRAPSAPPNAYVVVEPFAVPTGLFGAHAVTFYVFKGDKPPVVRDLGHSTLHDANKYKCK